MNVLACVDPLRLGRLRAALAERHRLHVALDWAHAAHLLNHEAVDVLVADPAMSGGEAATDAIALIIRTLEKIDSLQRQLARDRTEADERQQLSQDPETLRQKLAVLIEARVRERVDVELAARAPP